MRIKKHSNHNEYLLTKSGLWVRNFSKEIVPYLDINHFFQDQDLSIFLENEVLNSKTKHQWIDSERCVHENIVIVSDGYKFLDHLGILAQLPVKNVAIIAVNGALVKWRISERSPTYYVVNNPYPDCMLYMPKRVFPKCIASTRTYHQFVKNYKGILYRYAPVADAFYAGSIPKEIEYQIDDYRNPICAAIGLAYRFGGQKIVLLDTDDSFATERPGAEQLANDLWQYPTQQIPHDLIDGNLYWLKKANPDIEIKHCTSGAEYEQSSYIPPEEIVKFFENNDRKI